MAPCPVVDPLPELEPLVPPPALPADPVLEPDDDPVPPELEELPGVEEPLDDPLPPEPVGEGVAIGVEGLFAAAVEEPLLPQPISSSTEPSRAALRRWNGV